MEKLCYLWWPETGSDTLGDPGALVTEIKGPGVERPSLHIAIDAPADSPHALLTVWIECHDRRGAVEECLATRGGRLAGYLVTESVFIDRPASGEATTASTPGASRLALMERPSAADDEDWLDQWPASLIPTLERTTIERYVRNVVARALTPEAPPIFLVLEERWPSHHSASAPVDEHAPVVLEADEYRWQDENER